ncbi:MAG: phosphoribosyl-AMP cyclohydrolase [Acidobacteria bacterium]|nr:phosphoribosyl-AMP cyclohydrolase [Acidobacteriota bacterium]
MSGDKTAIEEGAELLLDFGKLRKAAACGQALVPAVAQDVDSGEVLIIGYANRMALEHALKNGVAAFWSTSRNELWVKGATSGDFLDIVEIRVNCEQTSLLYRVKLRGRGSCHTRDRDGVPRLGCFYRRIEKGKLVFVPDPREASDRCPGSDGGARS